MEIIRIGVLSSPAVLRIIVVWFCLSGLDMEVSLVFFAVFDSTCSSCTKERKNKEKSLRFSTKQNANVFRFFVCFLYIKEIKGSYRWVFFHENCNLFRCFDYSIISFSNHLSPSLLNLKPFVASTVFLHEPIRKPNYRVPLNSRVQVRITYQPRNHLKSSCLTFFPMVSNEKQ